jgi:ATP:cob(I)alamin adenosyltransferase
MFKFSKDRDEMSYPFMYEHSYLCDFEILTDELCTVVGLAGSACQERDADLQQALFELQPFMFNLNGSIRGRNAITEKEVNDLKEMLSVWRKKLPEPTAMFVLPRGTGVVVNLHYARSLSKKVTRMLVRIDQEGKDVPSALPPYTNVLTNLFFAMTQVVNFRDGVTEPEYVSVNYG